MNQYTHNGKTITLIQDAYFPAYSNEPDYYQAVAEDEEGNQYMVIWNVTHPDFENLEDESEACDWENPSCIERI